MSEVSIAKRKEKCENCTKQVQVCLETASFVSRPVVFNQTSICPQCNKKQGDEDASPHLERDEAEEEVTTGGSLVVLSGCLFSAFIQNMQTVDSSHLAVAGGLWFLVVWGSVWQSKVSCFFSSFLFYPLLLMITTILLEPCKPWTMSFFYPATFLSVSRDETDPSCCWVPVYPVTAAYQRTRPWRFLNRTWRKWSRFWRSTRYNARSSRLRNSVCLFSFVFSLLFFCLHQKCDVSKHKVLVASVCPQSLPFFAVRFGLDVTEAAHKLCGFLKSLGELVISLVSVCFFQILSKHDLCSYCKSRNMSGFLKLINSVSWVENATWSAEMWAAHPTFVFRSMFAII